jgi:uncharacterized RDD family membrane protein YckC
MYDRIEFETPENIGIEYEVAGLGTRFVAWVVDSILLWLATIVIFIAVLVSGFMADRALRDWAPFTPDLEDEANITIFMFGLFLLVNGVSNFLYFGFSELLWRGQTIGKRQVGIRVVRADGFSLDAGSILTRNIFRVIDTIPLLWIVPVVSKRSQRTGDMVAGTIVVSTASNTMGNLRSDLAERPREEARFRFEPGVLKKLRPQDVEAIEKVLERWSSLESQQRDDLLGKIVPALATRLGVEEPLVEDRRQFLEDLLAAELRRQHRNLG